MLNIELNEQNELPVAVPFFHDPMHFPSEQIDLCE